jgi:cob(I)alamin adenosyltransferase
VKKSTIYTHTGDGGETGLVGGTRVSKADARIDLYGEVDELNARLGAVVAALGEQGPEATFLTRVQSALFDLGANLACEVADRSRFKLPGIAPGLVAEMESEIDRMDSALVPLKNFILPGGVPSAVAAHLARTGCRRVERLLISFGNETGEAAPAHALELLNRLSDHLFVLARWANHQAGQAETTWKP